MIVRFLAKIVMHTFFSRVQLHHGHRLPVDGPVVIVSNHHSALVDPAALVATLPRTPRFLAKATLWNLAYLPLRPVLWAAKAIPVYRRRDGGGDNTAMFAASHEALRAGEVIALFGEGVSHDMPGVLDLKTGAARLALGVDVVVSIVPVGLIYDDRAKFRSRAMVYVGEPIEVAGRLGGDDDRALVDELTAQISDALDDVAPSWETWEAQHAALTAARLVTTNRPELELGEVLTRLNQAVDDGEAGGTTVLAAVTELEAESSRIGVDVEDVASVSGAGVDRIDRRTCWLTALIAVPTVLGRVLHMPPHGLIGRLADRQRLDYRATFKILVGAVLYPLWWVAIGVVVARFVSGPVGVGVAATLPLLGYLAARWYGRIRRFWRPRPPVPAPETVRSSLAMLHGRVVTSTERLLAA